MYVGGLYIASHCDCLAMEMEYNEKKRFLSIHHPSCMVRWWVLVPSGPNVQAHYCNVLWNGPFLFYPA
jgi:hypothetical protein